MKTYTKRLNGIPNSVVMQIIKEVQEGASNGYKVKTDNIYLVQNPSFLDIELVFQKEDGKVEVNQPILPNELLVGTSEGMDEGIESVEEDSPIEMYSGSIKSDLIEKLEAVEKHAELKEIANKYNLIVGSNLRNPAALRKNLIEQVENL